MYTSVLLFTEIAVVVGDVSHIQRIGCDPKTNTSTIHGGQSHCSWSAGQGKENRERKSGSTHAARTEGVTI